VLGALDLDAEELTQLVPVLCVIAQAASILNADAPPVDCSANDFIDALQETEP